MFLFFFRSWFHQTSSTPTWRLRTYIYIYVGCVQFRPWLRLDFSPWFPWLEILPSEQTIAMSWEIHHESRDAFPIYINDGKAGLSAMFCWIQRCTLVKRYLLTWYSHGFFYHWHTGTLPVKTSWLDPRDLVGLKKNTGWMAIVFFNLEEQSQLIYPPKIQYTCVSHNIFPIGTL